MNKKSENRNLMYWLWYTIKDSNVSMRENCHVLLIPFASPIYYSLFLEVSSVILLKIKYFISQFTDTPVSAEMLSANY